MQNKKSIWSTLLLIATFLMLASVVVSIITVIVVLPQTMEAAKEIARQEAAAQGYSVTEEVLDLAMSVAKTAVIVSLVFVIIIAGLEILGGFLFSLKGKWGIFCIVVGVLGVLGGIGNLMGITATTQPATIISDVISFLVSGLFCVASIMHYIENKKAKEEQTI
ncbi:MAG: hypothetical protein IKQ34_04500 [Bacilli bacterium]|nr:hypothetical protein [Bacilli bacterium]